MEPCTLPEETVSSRASAVRTVVGHAAGCSGSAHEAEAGSARQRPKRGPAEVGAPTVHARRPLLPHLRIGHAERVMHTRESAKAKQAGQPSPRGPGTAFASNQTGPFRSKTAVHTASRPIGGYISVLGIAHMLRGGRAGSGGCAATQGGGGARVALYRAIVFHAGVRAAAAGVAQLCLRLLCRFLTTP